jgi:hypothetical protein
VTWLVTDGDGERQVRDFTDVDQGYWFYEDMRKGTGALSVTWEHNSG